MLRLHPRDRVLRSLAETRVVAVAAALVVSLATLTASAGEGVRLGTQVVPTFQFVSLRVNADEADYSGHTRIELSVRQATDTFRLHAEDMPVQSVALRGPQGAIEVEHEEGENATLLIRAAKTLTPGAYTLEIDFANGFGTKAVGLYRMEHEGQGYVFTQFEADDAREAFPCFDEPSFKIEWQVAVEVPEEHMVVTNTSAASETVENGWRKYTFKRTKPLPSYLIAIAAGRFETVPIHGMSIPGNVVTIKGQSHLTQLAIETTPPVLRELEQYFGARYPYEKLDLIAIPEYWPGAMEHPGAVTFAASVLLVDSDAASMGQRRTLARITAHELAHMWFGNLVTMEWWDDLWLNESFADWMGDKIGHRVYPQYNLEVTELQSSINAMVGDSRPSSMAIRRPVETTDNLLQNVGTQYTKGKAVLAMFEQWMGEDAFRNGVLDYLNKNRWGNARANDLWEALSRASGGDVTAAMATFIDQPGVPLVSVEAESGNKIRLRQSRFSNWGVEQEVQTWKVPINLRYSDGNAVHTKKVMLDAPSKVVSLDIQGQPQWVLPNADQRGYYRWEVPADNLRELATRSSEILNERERVGFIGNLSSLLDAGVVSGSDYLFALGEYAHDPKPMVVSALLGALGKVEMAFVTPELEDSFAEYVRATLSPALVRFGREKQPGEAEEVALFRPQLLRWLGDTGKDTEILDYAEALAKSYTQDTSSIDASLAGVALQLSAIRGDRALYDEYKKRFEVSEVPADRRRYLSTLGRFRDDALRDDALQFALEGPLRPNEIFAIPGGVMSQAQYREHMFEWFMDHYDDFAERLPPMFMGFMPFVAGGCSAERLAAAQVFFSEPAHQAPGTETQLAKVSDQVNDCVGLREREGDAVATYLERLIGSR